MKSVCSTHLGEIDIGRNVARPPLERPLEQKAWMGWYPGRETLAWVLGCRKVCQVHIIGGVIERL